jgi:cell division protein FtsN
VLKPVAPAVAPVAKPAAPTVAPVTPSPVTPKPKPITPPDAVKPAPVAAGTGTTLQLGAFSSAAKAEAAWTSLSGRYTWLGGLTKRIEPVARDGATLYRLRASGSADSATAAANCARLKVAGEACVVTP